MAGATAFGDHHAVRGFPVDAVEPNRDGAAGSADTAVTLSQTTPDADSQGVEVIAAFRGGARVLSRRPRASAAPAKPPRTFALHSRTSSMRSARPRLTVTSRCRSLGSLTNFTTGPGSAGHRGSQFHAGAHIGHEQPAP